MEYLYITIIIIAMLIWRSIIIEGSLKRENKKLRKSLIRSKEEVKVIKRELKTSKEQTREVLDLLDSIHLRSNGLIEIIEDIIELINGDSKISHHSKILFNTLINSRICRIREKTCKEETNG